MVCAFRDHGLRVPKTKPPCGGFVSSRDKPLYWGLVPPVLPVALGLTTSPTAELMLDSKPAGNEVLLAGTKKSKALSRALPSDAPVDVAALKAGSPSKLVVDGSC